MPTDYDIEVKKWDQPKSAGGHRPDRFEPYPTTLFRAARGENARIEVENIVVQSEGEQQAREREGWVPGGPDAAKAVFTRMEEAVGEAAAEAAGKVRSMSEKAQAEYAEAERTSEDHVTDVTPRKLGRPRKVTE